jgi:hypothetical protein
VRCNFLNEVTHTMYEEVQRALSLRVAQQQAEKFNESWNLVLDFHAKLKPIK